MTKDTYKNKIMAIMEKRGFELAWSTPDYKSLGFHRKLEFKISIGAVVTTKMYSTHKANIRLEYNHLRMLIQMNTGDLAFNHPDFNKFLKCLIFYVKKCEKKNPLDYIK